jgi:UDP:flavonoid glycosyltransferase YjiC (YdhE family)
VQRRIVLSTIGSLGDLHPFMAVGLALRARGAFVTIATAAEYRAKVERAGLGFHAIRPSFEDLQRDLGMDREQLTRAMLARNDFLLRRLIMPYVRASYEDMLAALRGADLVLTSSLSFGARLAAERCAVPWLAVVLQPLMFLSAYDPPAIPGAEFLGSLLRMLGPTATGWALRAVKRALAIQLKPVRELRRQVGLPPAAANPLFEGQFSSEGAIGLYSPMLGGVRDDYPRPTELAGFACFDSDDGDASALEPSLEAFLGAGRRPLVFTLGSLIVNSPGSFFRESLAAARILNERAVLLVGENAAAAYAGFASAQVHVAAYAPHSLLFPRAEAVVHQGGIGTLAQALRSGRPQLIVPFYADQIDNAARAQRLGVARSLAPARYDAGSAVRILGALTSDADLLQRARGVREVLLREDGAGETARIVMNRVDLQPA